MINGPSVSKNYIASCPLYIFKNNFALFKCFVNLLMRNVFILGMTGIFLEGIPTFCF